MKINLTKVYYVDYLNFYSQIYLSLQSLTTRNFDEFKRHLELSLSPLHDVISPKKENDILYNEVKVINVSIEICQEKLKTTYNNLLDFEKTFDTELYTFLNENILDIAEVNEFIISTFKAKKYDEYFDDIYLINEQVKRQINCFRDIYRNEIWKRFNTSLL